MYLSAGLSSMGRGILLYLATLTAHARLFGAKPSGLGFPSWKQARNSSADKC